MYEPRICVIVQGAKRVLLGDNTYEYDTHHFLITSVDLARMLASRQDTVRTSVLRKDCQIMGSEVYGPQIILPQAIHQSRFVEIIDSKESSTIEVSW